MEFFEKAHVKRKHAEENMKKQLRQMLVGYKNNDTKAIKTADNIRQAVTEETFSLSSYSDVECTDNNTCQDGDKVDANDSDSSVSNVDDLDISSFADSEPSQDEESTFTTRKPIAKDLFSISECDEDMESLSDDEDDKGSEQSHEKILICDTSSQSSTTVSSNSEPFDADGALASKIISKLRRNEESSEPNPKKSKIQQLRKQLDDWTIEEFEPKVNKKTHSNKDFDNEPMSETEEIRQLPKIPSETESTTDSYDEDDDSVDEDFVLSPPEPERPPLSPFVLIKDEEFEAKRLTDVMTGYHFPTGRNLPSIQQMPLTTDSIFVSDLMTPNEPILEENEFGLIMEENELEVNNEEETSDSPSNGLRRESDIIAGDEYLVNNDVTNEAQEVEGVLEREPSVESLNGTLKETIRVFYAKNTCIFVLPHPAQMYIHGKVRITALGGTARILGYTLNNSSTEVYAPNHNFAYCLESVETDNEYYGLFGKLTSSGLAVAEAEEIVTTLGELDAVVKMQPLNTVKMDFVENNFTVTDLFSKPNKNIDNCFKKASQLLGCSLYLNKPWRCFDESPSWGQVARYSLNAESKGIVCGGKGTGKSTFLRYYVNQCLTRGPVLVVDLDPGQCEFTVAGSVSATVVTEPLVGPNFTHLRKPDRMLNIGMINVMDNIRRYRNAVIELITYCSSQEQYQNMPWIVNTMGMCNTVGQKLMALIILLVKPTFLLQMDSKNVKKRFEVYLNPHTVQQLFLEDYWRDPLFHSIPSPEELEYSFVVSHQYAEGGSTGNYALAPRDERYLNFLAYFAELLEIHKTTDFLGIVPYEVPLQDLKIASNVKFTKEAASKVINGKIIALCQHDGDNAEKILTLGDKPLLCHGHGLIRGIDAERGLVYVSTPAAGGDTLLYADWTPELRVEPLPRGTALLYRTATLTDQKQLMFTPKRRFNPIQFLKMSRS